MLFQFKRTPIHLLNKGLGNFDHPPYLTKVFSVGQSFRNSICFLSSKDKKIFMVWPSTAAPGITGLFQ